MHLLLLLTVRLTHPKPDGLFAEQNNADRL